MDPNKDIRSAIARVKHTSTHSGRKALGLFSLEGTRAVERALRADTPIDLVVTSESFTGQREQDVLHLLKQREISIHILSATVMNELTEGRNYGQIIALSPIPDPPTLPEQGLFVVASDIADPGNVGGMIRTCLAAGADGLIATGASDPWHPKAVRTSMGSIFKLPIYPMEEATLLKLRGKKFATTPLAQTPINQATRDPQRTFVFMGSEAFGLSSELLEAIEFHLRIPMADGVDSFSVNVATGVVLYELLHGSTDS